METHLLANHLLATDWLARLIPHAATDYADEVDHLYYLIYWIVGITFVGVQSALIYYLFKYRARAGQNGETPKAKYSHGDHTLELIWTLTPAVILLFIALVQQSAWFRIKTEFPVPKSANDPDVLRVEVRAERFLWNFRYAGKDGRFDSLEAPSNDDVLTKTLTIPKGRKILLTVRSKDVLHSFFLPHFRVKQDTVPGLTVPVWFEAGMTTVEYAEKHGLPLVGPRAFKFDVVCAELCGSLHFNMKSSLDVLTEEEFAIWIEDQQDKVTKPIQADRAKKRSEYLAAMRHIDSELNKYQYEQLAPTIAALKQHNANLAEGQEPKTLPASAASFIETYDRMKGVVTESDKLFWGWRWDVGEAPKTTKEFQ